MRPALLRRPLRGAAPLGAAVVIAAVPLLAAEAPPILLIVPAGSDVARVEAARASVPASRALLLVGASERIGLQKGLELVVDRTFSEAPAAEILAVLPGEAAGLEEFLTARRATAKAILFLGDSPLAKRLKGDGSRGALILVGGVEAIAALAGGETAGRSATSSRQSESPRGPEAGTPPPSKPTARETSPTPAESAVRRYFSPKGPTPTPSPGRER